MSKKVKLEFTGQELRSFNRVWAVELDTQKLPWFIHIVRGIVKELAVKFLKKAIGSEKKHSLTLKEYEAIALREYLKECLIHNEGLGAYEENLVRTRYLILDQKTV